MAKDTQLETPGSHELCVRIHLLAPPFAHS